MAGCAARQLDSVEHALGFTMCYMTNMLVLDSANTTHLAEAAQAVSTHLIHRRIDLHVSNFPVLFFINSLK